MRRKRKRKLRRFGNRFADWIWNRALAIAYSVVFDRAFSGGNVQNALARAPTL